MTGELRNTLRIVDPEYSPGPGNKEHLSIGLLPGGFVFTVIDNARYKYLSLEEYRQNDKQAPYSYLSGMEEVLSQRELAGQGFQKVTLSYFSRDVFLLPGLNHQVRTMEAAFGLSASLPEGHCLRHDELNILKGTAIYALPKTLLSHCDKLFDNYRLRHHATALIESTLASQKLDAWNADLFLHLHRGYFDMLLLNKQKLLFYRSFVMHGLEDLLYHVFFVLEQFEWRASSLHAVLAGTISMDSSHYDSLSRYFRRLSFPEKNDIYRYGQAFDQIPYHYHFNLLNLDACG